MFLGHISRRASLPAAFAATLFLGAASLAGAQTTSASISGSVRDAQAAVLPGATVSLTSETQGTVQTVTTDSLGNFLFPYVRPDTYTLSISLAGFRRKERGGLVVNASDRITAGSFVLEIGDRDETIEVTAKSSSDIQLNGGERSFTLQSTATRNLGVNGRTIHGLVALAPGVVLNTASPTSLSAFNVNGQRANSNNLTIDGVGNLDTGDNGASLVQMNLDAVAEFKVLTSSYQAEYGRVVGGHVQVVTKSGARDFRGSAYWYGRRSEWNANTWLNERDGTPKEKSARNDMGYTFGGPVYVPGFFEAARNKLFFFWNQEFQRRTDPVSERRVTVPTELERKGDFSQSVDASGKAYPYIRDATTGLPCTAANTSGCFKYEGVLGRIDPGRLYAPTLAALGLFPAPNVTGQAGYNYKSQTPSHQPLNESLLRMDYQASGNWRITGRFMWHTNTNEMPYGLAGSNVPMMNGIAAQPGYNWLASTTRVLSPSTSVEISVGSGHNSIDNYSASDRLTRSAAGMSALPMLFPQVVQGDMVPSMSFAGGRVANPAQLSTALLPFTNFNTTYDVIGNLTTVARTHAFKTGVYFQRSLKDQAVVGAFNGAFSFANDASNPNDSSHPFANAALGIYSSFTQYSAYYIPAWRYSNLEWYVQDNWKPVSKLTVDYGVRFYAMTPSWDASLRASNWLQDQYDAAQAVRLFQPAVVNGVRVGYDATTGKSVPAAFIGRVVPNSGNRSNGAFQAGQGISQTLTDGNKFRVSPRAGFAWDLTGEQRLVARGGFAVLYDRPEGNQVYNLGTNPPGLQTSVLTWGLAKDVASATVSYPTIQVLPSAYHWKIPTVYQWNVGLQARLPADFTLDVAYVGSNSKNLLQVRNLNAVPYGAAYQASNQDPTRGQACAGCSAVSASPGANALPADFMRPYAGYTNINLWEFGAYSNYNALQATLSRRLSKGLALAAHYMGSSAKGTLGSDFDTARIDGRDREANYGPLVYDRPHNVAISFVYQAPDFARGALGYLTNGWQVSGNYRWMSGTPYTAGFVIAGGSIGPVNLTGSNTESARIALTGAQVSSGWSDDPYRQFSLLPFTAPKPGSIGLESPRYTMRLPPVQNVDLSLSKSFPFGGKRRLELRVDAFNALNFVTYTGVNSTIYYKSLTDTTVTNVPYDVNGTLVNKFGVGTVSSVGPARQMQAVARFTF